MPNVPGFLPFVFGYFCMCFACLSCTLGVICILPILGPAILCICVHLRVPIPLRVYTFVGHTRYDLCCDTCMFPHSLVRHHADTSERNSREYNHFVLCTCTLCIHLCIHLALYIALALCCVHSLVGCIHFVYTLLALACCHARCHVMSCHTLAHLHNVIPQDMSRTCGCMYVHMYVHSHMHLLLDVHMYVHSRVATHV